LGKIELRLTLDYFFGPDPHSGHELPHAYGQDFLSVRNTMGVHAIFVRQANGKIARPWSNESYFIDTKFEPAAKFDPKVLAAGPLRAIIRTNISNWGTDAGTYQCRILYSICSMQRHTNISVGFTNFPGSPQDLQMGAGMRQMYQDVHYEKNSAFITAVARDVLEHGIVDRYVARAIINPAGYDTEELRIPNGATLKRFSNNGPNYGLLFPRGQLAVSYAFLAAWEKDGAITSVEQWHRYLKQLNLELQNPLIASLPP